MKCTEFTAHKELATHYGGEPLLIRCNRERIELKSNEIDTKEALENQAIQRAKQAI